MNASKSQKKRKKVSQWIVSNFEDNNVNDCDNGDFTIYEMDAFVLAVSGKTAHNSTEAIMKIGKSAKRKKNKLKQWRSGFKNAKLQSSQECNGVNEEVIDSQERYKIESAYGVACENEPNAENDTSNSCHENGDGDENVDDFDQNDEINNVNSTQESSSMKNKNVDEGSHSESIGSIDSKNDCDLSIDSDPELEKEEPEAIDQNSLWSKQNWCAHHLYKIENGNKYILHLPLTEKFHFQGKIQITLLYGEIEVFGYELNHLSKNKTLQLYSPRRCMQLSVASKSSSSAQDTCDIDRILQNELKLSKSDLHKLQSRFNPNDSLLLIEKLFVQCSLILDHYCDYHFFLEKEVTRIGEPVEKDLGCFLDRSNAYEKKGFTQGKYWRDIVPEKCTVICGGKGVGKSTFLKFLINSQLRDKDAVLCLDFDPGQTEFITPGCVSAAVVKKPFLGPNFTNIITPAKMAYIGIVNVALDPVKYIRAVNYIVQSCREDHELSNLPWFVNTMGFNKGIGLDIMVNIIRILQPDGLIQINSSDKSRNYEITLNPEVVGNCSVLPLLPVQDGNLKYKLYSMNSCSRKKGVGFQSGFRPAELREFMILSYLSPVVSLPYCSLNAVQPRWIHFSKICIAVNALVQSNYILKAINGNVVSLCNINGVECRAKSIATTDSNDCYLKIAIQPEVAPCFGIGLVRGIDCSEERIYIVTPVSNEELENVNCLYLGNVNTPSSIYLRQKYVNEPTVYTDVPGTRNVRTLKQTFRYIPQFQKPKS